MQISNAVQSSVSETKPFILWLTFARSGSNYLSDLLANIPEVESFREVFQSRGVHVYNGVEGDRLKEVFLPALNKAYGAEFTNIRDEALIKLVHDDPDRLLKIVRDTSDRDYVSFKIFIDHLSDEKVKEMLADSAKYVPLVYQRHILDTFISAMKVKEVDTAIGKDTTKVKPVLDVETFRRFRQRRKQWITLINQCSDHIKYAISYDRMMELPDDDTRIQGLKECLAACGLGINLDHAAKSEVSTIKQDANDKRASKVANFREFIEECRVQGVPTGNDFKKIKIPEWTFE